MSFLKNIFLLGTGIISGIYLDQNYKLPKVEDKFYEYKEFIRKYEPPKKND